MKNVFVRLVVATVMISGQFAHAASPTKLAKAKAQLAQAQEGSEVTAIQLHHLNAKLERTIQTCKVTVVCQFDDIRDDLAKIAIIGSGLVAIKFSRQMGSFVPGTHNLDYRYTKAEMAFDGLGAMALALGVGLMLLDTVTSGNPTLEQVRNLRSEVARLEQRNGIFNAQVIELQKAIELLEQ